jgi:molecular chaperone DnaJ
VVEETCGHCRSAGCLREEKALSVKVAAGIDTGDRIRSAGEGEAAEHGGSPGDLYVQVKVEPHPIFTREESHLFCEVPIGFVHTALARETQGPTLGGKVILKGPLPVPRQGKCSACVARE